MVFHLTGFSVGCKVYYSEVSLQKCPLWTK